MSNYGASQIYVAFGTWTNNPRVDYSRKNRYVLRSGNFTINGGAPDRPSSADFICADTMYLFGASGKETTESNAGMRIYDCTVGSYPDGGDFMLEHHYIPIIYVKNGVNVSAMMDSVSWSIPNHYGSFANGTITDDPIPFPTVIPT